VFEEVVSYLRSFSDDKGLGFVDVTSMRAADEVFGPYVKLITALRGTRNLTFGIKSIEESLQQQRDYFSEDLSDHATKDPNDPMFSEMCNQFRRFMRDLLQDFTERRSKWDPAPLHQKGTACTEKLQKDGGRDAFDTGIVNDMLMTTISAHNQGRLILCADFMSQALNCEEITLPFSARICNLSEFEKREQIYFGVWNFQEMKLFCSLEYCLTNRLIDIDLESKTGDYLVFTEKGLRFAGSRIIEMADKDRTVCKGRASVGNIVGFIASKFRNMLLVARPEYHEGYLGGEEMTDFLSRLNGKESDRVSPFHSACQTILNGSSPSGLSSLSANVGSRFGS
jgi:hypothetical protein